MYRSLLSNVATTTLARKQGQMLARARRDGYAQHLAAREGSRLFFRGGGSSRQSLP
jgi:hypothetical protein